MTEGEENGTTGAAAEPAPKPKTAGQWLKAVRQERGLHIAALAAMLKVPQAKLEALEADRYADLPDATFARALAKAVCRTLKVDATPVMALLPRGDEHELHVSLGINAPYREAGRSGEGLSSQWLQKPLTWAVGLLLLAAVGIYLMPAGWLERAAPAAAAPVAASAPASEPVLIAAPAAVVPASAPASMTTQLAQPTASAPAPTASKPAAVAVVPAPAAGDLAVTLKATAASWVEVVDAHGETLISRVLAGGEEEQLSGVAPLKVKIGNVAGTQLLVRGKPMDLHSQSKDNVARLELN